MNPQTELSHQAHLTLLLGGVRSGKSAKAVALATARQRNGPVLFVATAQALDDEMATRIAAHRQERPETWETLESPLHIVTDLDRALAAATEPYATIVIDCVTLWVSNILMSLEDHDDAEAIVGARVRQLLEVHSTVRRAPCVTGSDTAGEVYPNQWIIISNEVGLGIVPPTRLGRSYRDALGRANQLLADAADEVTLMVAGLELPLKRRQPDSNGR